MFTLRSIGMGPLVALALAAGLVCGCEKDDPPAPVDPFAPPPPAAPAPKHVSVDVSGGGNVTSTTANVGIDCTKDDATGSLSGRCAVDTSVDLVALEAKAAPGFEFDHWEVSRGTNAPVNVPENGLHSIVLTGVTQVSSTSVTAKFAKKTTFEVESFAPFVGPFGSKVTVSGSALGGARAVVTIGGKQAEVLPESTDTQLVVVVPAGATSGPIVVTNGDRHDQTSTWFHVGLGSSDWTVTRPDAPSCFDLQSGYVLGTTTARPFANEPDPPSQFAPAGFSLLVPVYNSQLVPYRLLRGTWNDDGTFQASYDLYGDGTVTTTATGSILADGTASGTLTVHVAQGDYHCDESGAFTVNR